MPCGITDPLDCAGRTAAGGLWDAICQSFAAAADTFLRAFAEAFAAIPTVDLASPGVRGVYAVCLGIAGVVATLLLLGQVARTALTHDGSALAEGLTGLARAAVAFLVTLAVAAAAVTAADDLTRYIIDASFGSAAALTSRITALLSFTGTALPGGTQAGLASLLALLAVIGILLILVLWFELLLRSAAIAVLVATSPIAAVGQLTAATKGWWHKTASATGQLIILKPAIALIFALGFGLTGEPGSLETLLAGMLILLLAVIAWPVIARFFTFTQTGRGTAGLSAVLGFAAGRLTAAGPAPAGAGRTGTGAAAAEGSAGAATAGVLTLAAAGARAAHRSATALAGQMEQVAEHAGLDPMSYWRPGSHAPPARMAAARPPAPGRPPGPASTGDSRAAGDWRGHHPAGSAAPDAAGDSPSHYPDSGDGWAHPLAPAEPDTAGRWPEHYPAGSGDDWARPGAPAGPGPQPDTAPEPGSGEPDEEARS
ncbi:MAG TPA: conjugal transfer protein TrbL family protein [Streptosporangiaceae bacterium]|jgi:hypothetical protein